VTVTVWNRVLTEMPVVAQIVKLTAFYGCRSSTCSLEPVTSVYPKQAEYILNRVSDPNKTDKICFQDSHCSIIVHFPKENSTCMIAGAYGNMSQKLEQ